MQTTIHYYTQDWKLCSFQRVLRHQMVWRGNKLAAIHDTGYLILVRFDEDKQKWFPRWVIRKLR